MKRCWIHIGMHKTGTTSVQSNLADTPDPDGWTILKTGGRPNMGMALYAMFATEPHKFHLFAKKGLSEQQVAEKGERLRRQLRKSIKRTTAETVVISAAIEEEIAQMPEDEQPEYLEMNGLSESGLDRLIAAGYRLLDLITYFTAGPKETRAWTVSRGSKAPQAAGVIHTDFEKGFIRAQTIAFDDYVSLGGEHGAKEAGKARDEGKEYIVQDGDVMLFKFNT